MDSVAHLMSESNFTYYYLEIETINNRAGFSVPYSFSHFLQEPSRNGMYI